MEAIVLCGGLGTRLRAAVSDLPKSMADINGKPFLAYQLQYLKQQGITKVILAAGYKHEAIIDYFGATYLDMTLSYSIEDEPLGTGGAIVKALQQVKSEYCYILNGDTLFTASFASLKTLQNEHQADLSLALRVVEDVSRYGEVTIDENGQVTGFFEKNQQAGKGLINGGIYYVNTAFVKHWALDGKFSFEKEILEKRYTDNKLYGMPCTDYFLDIGIPEDYERAKVEFTKFTD